MTRIDLGRPALVVVDVQNDFCHPQGWAAKAGLDTSSVTSMMPRLERLLATARAASVPIVFIQLMRDPDAAPSGRRTSKTSRSAACQRDTWGSELMHFTPLPGEHIVRKTHHSAFYNTEFESLLGSLDVDTLVFTGVSTNVCVESSLRDAHQRDFSVLVVSDCTAAYDQSAHLATLANVARHFGRVVSADEISEALSAGVKV